MLRQTEEIPSLRHLSLALATIFIFLVPFLSALIRGLERCAHETDEELAFSVPLALVFPARHANCQSLHARREPRAVEVQFQVSPPGSRAGNRKVLPPHHQEPGEEVAEATARHAQPRRVLLFQEVREPEQYQIGQLAKSSGGHAHARASHNWRAGASQPSRSFGRNFLYI